MIAAELAAPARRRPRRSTSVDADLGRDRRALAPEPTPGLDRRASLGAAPAAPRRRRGRRAAAPDADRPGPPLARLDTPSAAAPTAPRGRRLLAAPRRHPQALRPRHRGAALAVAAPARAGARRCACTRTTSTALGVAAGTTGHVSSARRLGRRCRPSPTTACPRGRPRWCVNQPGAAVAALIDAAAPGHRRAGGAVTSHVLGARSAARRRHRPRPTSLIVLLKVVVTFVLLLVVRAVHDLVRAQGPRRHEQPHRPQPGRARSGILQTLADGIKFFFKEDLLPDRADRHVFILAPFLSLVPAFLVFSVDPDRRQLQRRQAGRRCASSAHDTFLQLADPPIGILLVLACSSIAVYGVMLAGWSSGSKYPLLGSVRASAQMVSYEAALGLSVVDRRAAGRLAVDARHRA